MSRAVLTNHRYSDENEFPTAKARWIREKISRAIKSYFSQTNYIYKKYRIILRSIGQIWINLKKYIKKAFYMYIYNYFFSFCFERIFKILTIFVVAFFSTVNIQLIKKLTNVFHVGNFVSNIKKRKRARTTILFK